MSKINTNLDLKRYIYESGEKQLVEASPNDLYWGSGLQLNITVTIIHDLADEVLKAPTAAEAKSIASRVPRHLHKDWHSIKNSVMKEILHIKADYCAHFKQSLLDSLNCRIVEAVQGDLY